MWTFYRSIQILSRTLKGTTHAHDVGGESWSEHSPKEEVIWQKMAKSSSVWEFSFHAWSSRFSRARKRRLNEARWGEREVLSPSLPSFLFSPPPLFLNLTIASAESPFREAEMDLGARSCWGGLDLPSTCSLKPSLPAGSGSTQRSPDS